MLHNVIPVIANELNTFIKLKYETNENKVIVSNLVGQDGNTPPTVENKVVCSLINIEQERLQSSGKHSSTLVNNPPINIIAHVVFAANFASNNYVEALKFLSSIIAFFQGKRVFDSHNTPKLSENVNKITFEIINLDMRELGNLWSAIGAKYLPSIIYKLRMITYDEGMILEEVPKVSAIDTDS